MRKNLFPIYLGNKLKKKIKNQLLDLERSHLNLLFKKNNQSSIYWLDASEIDDYEDEIKDSFLIILNDSSQVYDFSKLERGPYIVYPEENFEVRILEILTSIYSKITHYIEGKAEPSLKLSLRRFSDSEVYDFPWMESFLTSLMGSPNDLGQDITKALSITPMDKYWKIEKNVLEIYNKNIFFLPTYFENNEDFLVPKQNNIHDKKMLHDVLGFIYIINELKLNQENKLDSWSEIEIWDDIFQEIQDPLVIISPVGEIITHNKSFLELELTALKCLELNDGDLIETGLKTFRVFKKSSSRQHIYFYFLENSDFYKQNMNQDLGIITSSLAHELNNPLAGILSVINLLELEDLSGNEDIETLVEEMKMTTLRVKKLISTFLGFSRKEVELPEDSFFNQISSFSFEEVFDQVKEILRFKMIELNSHFLFEFKKSESNLMNLNESMLVMLLYQVMSELSLELSQRNLITNSMIKDRIQLIERKESFEIQSEQKIEYIKHNKLLSYLLKSLKLEMTQSEKKLIFSPV